MQTRYGARPKRVRDSGTGPAQASGLAPAAQPDDRQPDEPHEHPQVRAQGSALGMPDNARLGPGLASPQPHGATAGAQRAAAGVSPGGRPVAPPGLGRLLTVVTPVGDMHGIDESIPGIEFHFWADDPSCSSTSSSYPSSFIQRALRRPDPTAPPPATQAAVTPTGAGPSNGGQLVPYVAVSAATASSASQVVSSTKIERLLESLRHTREAEAIALRAEQVARAIEAEQLAVRIELQRFKQSSFPGQPTAASSASAKPNSRQRKPMAPSRRKDYLTENSFRDLTPDTNTYLLHEQHSQRAVFLLTGRPALADLPVRPRPALPTAPAATAEPYPMVVATTMAVALQGDHEARCAAWAKASSAISLAALQLIPPQLGRNKKGGMLITSAMRDQSNKTRAACHLVGALTLKTCHDILGGDLRTRAEKLHDSELYAVECANGVISFFARWGVSTLKGALSTLIRLRAFAEAKGEYEAADEDIYPAHIVSSFLDHINVNAIKAAAAYHAKAAAEGRELTTQQQRRDGRSAAKTAFRSLRFLLDNAKMANASRDALVGKRKFGTTIPTPTPSLEPPHYAQLCYLAAHHSSPVVRGTAAGFALVASQTSRFKQAQACAIVAEKKGILYTAVQIDKSNEPHKQSARPAFGPVLDAYGSRGVIEAVYEALQDVEDGCFLVRDNDSSTGAPVDGSEFTNGPILGGRADAALQYLLALPPLSCTPPTVLDFKVHSLKPMMLKHAARMRYGPVERHGLGRFSGSAAQNAALVPEPAELKRHKLRCAQLPDRYAQDSAFAADARTAFLVSRDIQRLVKDNSIEALASMEWAENPEMDDPVLDEPPIEFTLRERLEMTARLAKDGLLDGVDGDYGD